MKLSDLTTDTRNANRGTARGRKAVVDSLTRYGAGRSILIDRNGKIIAGNKTLAAATSAGFEDVIVVQSDGRTLVAVQRTDLDLDDPKAMELGIADNRSAQLGLEWDSDVLGSMVDELDLQPFFTDNELNELLPQGIALAGDEDTTPFMPAEATTQPGDLYLLGNHRLLCGDSTNTLDVDRLLDGAPPDMVFNDPPYGISVQMNNPGTTCKGTIMGDETTDVATAAYNLCTTFNVPMLFWGANHYSFDARLPNSSCWICWNKQESNNHIDQSDCEFAWTNFNQPARVFHHLWSGFRRDSEKGETRVHPTQKPVALLVEILDFFKAGTNILDLFGGSGSTLIACETTKRNAYLMEIDPRYCDVIVKRWENATGQKAERE